MPPNDVPIFKLTRSKQAKAFLKKHKSDPVIGGGVSACLPYNSFTKIINNSRKAAVVAITECMDMLSEKDQVLAKMFLEMTPRAMALKLGMSRSLLYDRLRKMRNRALKLHARKRAGYISQRDGSAYLDTMPEYIAIRSLRLTLNDQVKFCYLVERDNETVWVDAGGQRFSPEICNILSNYREDIDPDGESALEIEEW